MVRLETLLANNGHTLWRKKRPEFEDDSTIDDLPPGGEIDRLSDRLEILIRLEEADQDYRELCKPLQSYESGNLQDMVRNFLNIDWEPGERSMSLFHQFIRDQGWTTKIEDLKVLIDNERERIQQSQFEKSLEAPASTCLLDELDSMTGLEFENLLARLYRKMGYAVTLTKRSGDAGADLMVDKFGESTVIQAKRYSSTVGVKAIQEVTAAIKHYRARRGAVITTNYFTKQAIRLANSNGIELIDRGKLEDLLRRYLPS